MIAPATSRKRSGRLSAAATAMAESAVRWASCWSTLCDATPWSCSLSAVNVAIREARSVIQIAETATMQARPQPTSHVHSVRVEDGFPVTARPAESNPEDRIPMATITHAIGAALESVGLRRPAKRLRDGGRCKDFLDQADAITHAITDRGLGLVCPQKGGPLRRRLLSLFSSRQRSRH